MNAKQVCSNLEDQESGTDGDIGHAAEDHFSADEISAVRKELTLRRLCEQQAAEWIPIVEALRASAPPLRTETVVALDPASLIAFEAAHEMRCAMVLQATESAELMQDQYPAVAYLDADGVRRNESFDYRATFADGSQQVITIKPSNLLKTSQMVPASGATRRARHN
ncbi:hypothetical protein CO661_00435 [Sinorhizobium fredii]|uniref:Uncharacterized protein n=1 Tax=Rhizobium fredii TaxID=380 RepID=A0A2A6M702_RHIFR|nr:hypothetical protein [Sinorhizobium fredii]PDT50169.1 hypothetical protein CO661_00435 [Sinorhizobium fredii]